MRNKRRKERVEEDTGSRGAGGAGQQRFIWWENLVWRWEWPAFRESMSS